MYTDRKATEVGSVHLYEKRSGFRWKGLAVTVVVFVAVILLFSSLMGRTEETANREQTSLLEAAIRNAAVTSYATEGKYPATLEEIVQTYGVVIDHDRFYVRYDVFGTNIMPDIYVIVKGEGEA